MAANQSEGSVLVSLFERGPLETRFALERISSDDGLGARAIAFDREATRRVVVRLGRPRSSEIDDVLDRLAELRHGKSAELVAHGRHREFVYAVSAMVSGRRLSELLDEVGSLRLREFAPIASQLLMPIADAHSRGLALGGVRIEDVFLQERNGRALLVKVIDLGLRRVFASASDPAVEDPNPDDPFRSDVFAVGLVFARLLTGVQVRARDAALWWASQRHEAEVSPDLVDLIGRALEPEPSRRPNDAHAFVEALIDCVPSSMFRLPTADGSPCGDTGRWSPWQSSPSHPRTAAEPRPASMPTPAAATFSFEEATPRRNARRIGMFALVPILIIGMGIVSASSFPEPAEVVPEIAAEAAVETPVAAPRPVEPASETARPVTSVVVGDVVIASTPPGELYIDGKPAGSTPFARPLPLGRHDLQIVSDGHETWTATVVVQPGETSRFDVTRALLRPESRHTSRARKRRSKPHELDAKPEPVADRRPFLGRGHARVTSESSREAFLPPTR